ncbi:hypothetical protein EJB05_12838, partial [Eragrostis curvula]
MPKEKRSSRNKSKMSLRKESSPPMPTTVHDIPDKLLELILLNLTSPLWIIRAAATCRRWRRIVSRHLFLGILRHHPPDAAGYYYPLPQSGGSPTFVPASSSAIDRRYFSLDFLPGGSRSWKLTDSSGSLLLLTKRKGGWMRHCFPDIVVCEPLTRRFQLVTRPAEMRHHECLGVFLHGNCNGLDRFVVTCVLYELYTGVSGENGTIRSCLFDRRRRGMWYWSTSQSVANGGLDLRLQSKGSSQFLGRDAEASFWWVRDDKAPKRLLCVLWSAWFRLPVLPQHIQRLCTDENTFRFVDGGDHMMRIVCLEGRTMRVFAVPMQYWYDDSGRSDWMLENIIDLSVATSGLLGRKEEYLADATIAAKIINVRGRCVVLVHPGEEMWPFSVDIRTMRVERWNMGSKSHDLAYRYELPWPPRLQACLCPCPGFDFLWKQIF